MTLPDITATWTWTGDRDLPDWLTGRHHWHHGQPVIHTADGSRTLHDGWLVALWSDGLVTVGSNTVADRVYGPDGLAGRLQRAETATDSELRRQLADAVRALGKSETELAALRAVARGYCPHCGRGDASPTTAQWYAERQRADQAEGQLRHLQATSEAAGILLTRTTDERDQLRGALARVQALADRWVKAGPPPLGTSINRWWDKRLVELNAVLSDTKEN